MENSKNRIVEAAVRVIRTRGPLRASTEEIAREAGCAKGLIHYHFRGKDQLWEAVILHLAENRTERWRRAFRAANPEEMIQSTWRALLRDHETGTFRLIGVLAGASEQADQTVRRVLVEFAEFLGAEVASFLNRLELRAVIPEQQIGWMLATAATGAAMHLGTGAAARDLENGYAATWIGILSLTGGPA